MIMLTVILYIITNWFSELLFLFQYMQERDRDREREISIGRSIYPSIHQHISTAFVSYLH